MDSHEAEGLAGRPLPSAQDTADFAESLLRGGAAATVIVARGPFDLAGDTALLKTHRADLVVAKNAGGKGASAKLAAARALGLPVLMIDRPVLPPRPEVQTVAQVIDWLDHGNTERGV